MEWERDDLMLACVELVALFCCLLIGYLDALGQVIDDFFHTYNLNEGQARNWEFCQFSLSDL